MCPQSLLLTAGIYNMMCRSNTNAASVVFALLTRWKIDSFSFEDFEQLKNNLLSSLIHSLNKHNHDSFMSLPHHARFIDNLKKCQGLQEASASGLLVRTHLTQPFLLYSLDNLSEEFTNAYSQSWCNNSIFGTFLNGIPTFKPLVVPQYPLPR